MAISPPAAAGAAAGATPAEPQLTISEVETRTGMPVSTLRFYEREFAGFIKTKKTLGGHRRYSEADIQKFLYIKELVQEKKLPLKKVRQALSEENEPIVLRRDLDLLIDVYHQLTEENDRLKRGMQELAQRLARIEEAQGRGKKPFRFFK